MLTFKANRCIINNQDQILRISQDIKAQDLNKGMIHSLEPRRKLLTI
jgi:hypothetical protein